MGWSLIAPAKRFILADRASISRGTTTTNQNVVGATWHRMLTLRNSRTALRIAGSRVTESGLASRVQANSSILATALSEHGATKRLAKPRQRPEARYTMETIGRFTSFQGHREVALQETHDDEQRLDLRGIGNCLCR